MKIETTTGSNKYMPKTARLLYSGIDWLGIVHHEEQTGQLGFNKMTNQYVMYLNPKHGLQLHKATVEAALLVAQPRRGPGRPPSATVKVKALRDQNTLPMRQHMVTLPDDIAHHARVLGDGNLSAGLRLCVTICTATTNVTTAPAPTDPSI